MVHASLPGVIYVCYSRVMRLLAHTVVTMVQYVHHLVDQSALLTPRLSRRGLWAKEKGGLILR